MKSLKNDEILRKREKNVIKNVFLFVITLLLLVSRVFNNEQGRLY